jgi:predicted site-specific integrase-resolvase
LLPMPRTTNSPPDFRSYLTVGDAAAFLGVSIGTLRYWDRTGKLKPARHPFSRYRLYRREGLEGLLKRAATKEPAQVVSAELP